MCVKDGARVSVSAAFVSGRTHPEDESQVTNFLCMNQDNIKKSTNTGNTEHCINITKRKNRLKKSLTLLMM